MSDDNLLHHCQHHFSSSWESREMSIWSESVRNSVLLGLLVSTSLRICGQLATDPSQRSSFVLSVSAGVLFYSAYVALSPRKCERVKMTVLLQVAQGYFLALALVLYPNYREIWVVGSSVVFSLYEISSFNGSWLNFALLARQFAMWNFADGYLSPAKQGVGVPYFMLAVVGLIVLFTSRDLRRKTVAYYHFCDSIEEQEAKMQAILQAIPARLIVVTEDLAVACFNASAQSDLHISTSQELADKLDHVHCLRTLDTTETLAESLKQQIASFMHSEQELATFGVTEAEGKYFEWKGKKCCWGEERACIVTASDTSSWVSFRARLRAESESKSELLRFVSHELRTPTNAILNLVENVMEAENISPKQQTELSIVLTSTHFLLAVVNDLLDFSRIIADKFVLVKQSFDVRKEISEVVKLVELQCQQKGLLLKVKFDDFVPELIYSDQNRLKQVILNLLSNALKFTFQGGIRIVCMLTDHNTLRISVKDTGIGIPKDKLAGLFQVFGVVEEAKGINPQGCGLGLYISNLLAVSLGSKPIEIRSKLGLGSEFNFEVHIYQHICVTEPGLQDATTEIEDERDSESLIASPRFHGGRSQTDVGSLVLLVDDSDFNRVVLGRMLEALNVQADEERSGLRAIAKIREKMRRGQFYRLILMDVEMPEMDGITATQEIRTLELKGELTFRPRIVACSAHRGREDFDRCIAAGMDDFLEKPISRERLQSIVRNL